ncbi:MAG TPA: bifunctional [glutamate--ammonia ligase]-adenylyl-L-tyrosine phosphorylase/[glutamate--ammonia-ligase] adenylyltransferase [Candidatus Binatia bacterium]|nr:bifunctional [glutamate--ammonia ligase]-adenylyl-L-tyrosine phosphorylase/[glutamate--ammonia-ligase] adenylyltransferase [Candidatus Binatia bacterium]
MPTRSAGTRWRFLFHPAIACQADCENRNGIDSLEGFFRPRYFESVIDLREISRSSADRRKLQQLLAKTPSPTMAKAHLSRLLEHGGAKSLRAVPPAQLAALFRLLGSSTYLSDILIRQGKHWPEVFLREIKIKEKTVAQHSADLEPLLTTAKSFDQFCAGLRRHKQREYLRIGARDLLPSVTMEETVRELSALAEASLDAAYRFSRAEVEQEFGTLQMPGKAVPNRFVILGMGKLGGRELNFSSDVDVIFLYEEDEGESSGGTRGKTDPRTFFTHVAKKMVHAMGEVTEEGFVFRIDLRLRPLGAHGPLVQSVGAAMFYYQSWGQCWERAAFIKARAVAADRDLGMSFLQELEPFVYRRYLDYTTVDELRHMKMRIENELLTAEGKKRNLKLGHGGIREVEFITQALQLVNGGYEPGVREPNTLRALDRLARHDFIPRRDQDKLAHAYRFLRQAEHKVQMVQEAHSHSIPSGEEEERALARRLGYTRTPKQTETERFWRDHSTHTQAVRGIFGQLFYGAQKELTDEGGSKTGSIWHDLDRQDLIIQELESAGFTDPDKAYSNLLAVRDGEPYAPPSPNRLKIMRTLGPALMTEVANSSAPDQALLNLSKFSQRIGGRTGFLRLLAENPATMRLLITLFAESQFLTDLFLSRPELIDTLIRVDLTRVKKSKDEMLADLSAAFEEAGDTEARLNALRRHKNEEYIRIGLHDLGGAVELVEVLHQLSDLAEACLQATLDLTLNEIREKFGSMPGGKFAILGMGKMGGRELDYNSDLDLVFIYVAPEEAQSSGGSQGPISAHDYYVRVGQKLITFLSAPTEEGIAYKIDMQLRPSGKSGPLVCSLDGFRDYHKTSSLLWERQALIKARFVAGDRGLGSEVEKVAENFAYRQGLTAEGIGEIHHLRMRMERELADEDETRFNLKKGRGGLVDIEFLTQMLQLTHGYRRRELRHRETLRALKALSETHVLKTTEYKMLHEGYLFLRRLDHRLRLERDQSIEAFERNPAKLNGVARALGYGRQSGKGPDKAGQKLLRDYQKKREKIRACYEGYFIGYF